jgi:ketosteroid isomerase-like protein
VRYPADVHVWAIRDGKIGRLHHYTDTLQFAQVAPR